MWCTKNPGALWGTLMQLLKPLKQHFNSLFLLLQIWWYMMFLLVDNLENTILPKSVKNISEQIFNLNQLLTGDSESWICDYLPLFGTFWHSSMYYFYTQMILQVMTYHLTLSEWHMYLPLYCHLQKKKNNWILNNS